MAHVIERASTSPLVWHVPVLCRNAVLWPTRSVERNCMEQNQRGPLLSKIDCVQIPVANLDTALSFYQKLGHELLWRTHDSIGLSLSESDSELVLQTARPEPEVDWLVESVDQAVERFTTAGGSVEVGPFDIAVGRCVIVKDPWGNRLVLLDMSKGRLATDASGNVVGNVSMARSTDDEPDGRA